MQLPQKKLIDFSDKMASMNEEFQRENKNSRKKENGENKKAAGLTHQRDQLVSPVPPTRATQGDSMSSACPVQLSMQRRRHVALRNCILKWERTEMGEAAGREDQRAQAWH